MKLNNKNNTLKRRDPLTEVVDIDCLKIAFDLVRKGQNQTYWETHPTPVRPLGRVRFEGLRQLATFVLPFALLYVAFAYLGDAARVMAIPLAIAMGFLLNLQLKHATRKQLELDIDRDRGRYEAVRALTQRLNLKPEEITLERIVKMGYDFMTVAKTRIDAWNAQYSDASIQAVAQAQAVRFSKRREVSGYDFVPSATASGFFADVPVDISHLEEVFINPATGLMMNGGIGGVDAMGNTYGSDTMSHTSDNSSFDHGTF